jgi:hypothetical protein
MENIDDKIVKLKIISNDIILSLENVEANSYAYNYIRKIKETFIKNLDNILETSDINKYEIEILKLQDEREKLIKKDKKDKLIFREIMQLNEKMTYLNCIKNQKIISTNK